MLVNLPTLGVVNSKLVSKPCKQFCFWYRQYMISIINKCLVKSVFFQNGNVLLKYFIDMEKLEFLLPMKGWYALCPWYLNRKGWVLSLSCHTCYVTGPCFSGLAERVRHLLRLVRQTKVFLPKDPTSSKLNKLSREINHKITKVHHNLIYILNNQFPFSLKLLLILRIR